LVVPESNVRQRSAEQLYICSLNHGRTVSYIRHFLVEQTLSYRFNPVSFSMNYLQAQSSIQCSNIGTELMIDYSADFTTYVIFQSREAFDNVG